jgi:predicted Zn-dependent protease
MLVTGLGTILDIRSRLARTIDPLVIRDLRYEVASQLKGIGLREEAVDELLIILKRSPDDVRSLRLLVDVYVEKERYEPARFYLRKLVALEVDDQTLRGELQDLEKRW